MFLCCLNFCFASINILCLRLLLSKLPLARLVTSPSRHGSGSGGREPTARRPAPPPGRSHRLMMQRDLPLLQTRPAGLREAQGLTLGPTVVSRSRAAQSLARGLAQKPVGSALRCGRRFSGLLVPTGGGVRTMPGTQHLGPGLVSRL